MPVPLLLAAAPAIAQAGIGLYQTLFSGKNKAIKDLENQQSPIYKGSKPISDYYNEAKNRYAVSPYQSTQYLMAKQNADRAAANAINATQSRGGAMSSIGKIVGNQNDALLRAGAIAEQERNQRFGQLGSATGMKATDDLRKFNTNELDPFNRKYGLKMMKAGSASATKDAGLSNLFSGAANASMLMDNKSTGTPSGYNAANPYNARQFAYDAFGKKYYL